MEVVGLPSINRVLCISLNQTVSYMCSVEKRSARAVAFKDAHVDRVRDLSHASQSRKAFQEQDKTEASTLFLLHNEKDAFIIDIGRYRISGDS